MTQVQVFNCCSERIPCCLLQGHTILFAKDILDADKSFFEKSLSRLNETLISKKPGKDEYAEALTGWMNTLEVI